MSVNIFHKCFYFLILTLMLFSPGRVASQSAKDLLKQGVQQYEEADFSAALISLEQCIGKGLADKEDLIQAHKYLAFSYIALGHEEKAKVAYTKLLTMYPIFDLLLSDSPRLRKPFIEAKKEFESSQPPGIEFEPPAILEKAGPIELSAIVTAPAGVDSVTIFYKTTADSQFQHVDMKNIFGSIYIATIEPPQTVTGMTMYLQAKAKNGKITLWQDEANPHIITVQPKIAKNKISKKWLWIGVGAMAIGGGTTIALLNDRENKGKSTSKVARLPDPPDLP